MTAHIWRAIQDSRTGRLVNGATVTFCSPGTSTAISPTLYSDLALTEELPNPFVCASGIIDVYLAEPITVQLKTAYGSAIELADNIDVLPLVEEIVLTTSPLTITNAPGTNLFLTGIDGVSAQFVALDDVLASVPDVVLGWFLSQSLQLSSITRDTNGVMTSADVTWPDGVPGAYTADVISTVFPGKADSWHVTRIVGATTTTYTQPTVTRDDTGDIIAMPSVTIT